MLDMRHFIIDRRFGRERRRMYNLDYFLKVAEIVMERRDRTLTEAEQELLRHVFAATAPLRNFKWHR